MPQFPRPEGSEAASGAAPQPTTTSFQLSTHLKGSDMQVQDLTVTKTVATEHQNILGDTSLGLGTHYWEVVIERFMNDELYIGVARVCDKDTRERERKKERKRERESVCVCVERERERERELFLTRLLSFSWCASASAVVDQYVPVAALRHGLVVFGGGWHRGVKRGAQ